MVGFPLGSQVQGSGFPLHTLPWAPSLPRQDMKASRKASAQFRGVVGTFWMRLNSILLLAP